MKKKKKITDLRFVCFHAQSTGAVISGRRKKNQQDNSNNNVNSKNTNTNDNA